MRSRILIGLLAGTLGGFLGWLLQENLIHYAVTQDALSGKWMATPLSVEQTRTLVYCVGGLIGLFLGAVNGLVESNPRKIGSGMLIGALAGIVLGFIGYNLGAAVYGKLGGTEELRGAGIGSFARQVIARSFGWSLMGLGLGVGASIPTFSRKRIWHGAVGGFLGGFLGGFIFDLAAFATTPVAGAIAGGGVREVGGTSRMIGFTVIGGLTGFFIGLVEELLKQAWVRVLSGRNEGKDYILSKPVSILGRDERSDVPLFGDPGVAVQHAAIRADGHRHILLDAGTPQGTQVNGQRLDAGGEVLLRDNDIIEVGSQRILFKEKATASRIGPTPADAPKTKGKGGASALPPIAAAYEALPGAGVPTPGGYAPPPALPDYGAGGAVQPGFAPADGGYVNPAFASGGGLPGYAPPGVGTPVAGFGTPAAGRLVGIEGAVMGQVFSLIGENMTLGREPGRDITIQGDSTISRTHARLANENGTYIVYDNNSANGTYVNGMRITTQPLAPGDVIAFGASKFRFE